MFGSPTNMLGNSNHKQGTHVEIAGRGNVSITESARALYSLFGTEIVELQEVEKELEHLEEKHRKAREAFPCSKFIKALLIEVNLSDKINA